MCEAADHCGKWCAACGLKQDGLAVWMDTAAGFITSPCKVRSNALSCGITPRPAFYGYTQTSRNLAGSSVHKACSISLPFKMNRHFSYERKNSGLRYAVKL